MSQEGIPCGQRPVQDRTGLTGTIHRPWHIHLGAFQPRAFSARFPAIEFWKELVLVLVHEGRKNLFRRPIHVKPRKTGWRPAEYINERRATQPTAAAVRSRRLRAIAEVGNSAREGFLQPTAGPLTRPRINCIPVRLCVHSAAYGRRVAQLVRALP